MGVAEMNGWLCDTYLSDDIHKLSDKESEMDVYCRQCKSPNYKVSKWWIEKFDPLIIGKLDVTQTRGQMSALSEPNKEMQI